MQRHILMRYNNKIMQRFLLFGVRRKRASKTHNLSIHRDKREKNTIVKKNQVRWECTYNLEVVKIPLSCVSSNRLNNYYHTFELLRKNSQNKSVTRSSWILMTSLKKCYSMWRGDNVKRNGKVLALAQKKIV